MSKKWILAALTAAVSIGCGTAKFESRGSIVHSSTPNFTYYKEVVVADFNGDGNADFFLPQKQPGTAAGPGGSAPGNRIDHIFLGSGADLSNISTKFAFQNPAVALPNYQTDRGYDAEAEDLDGDGHLDIIRPDRAFLQILWGVGDGTFNAVTEPFSSIPNPNASSNYDDAAVADLDGDGDLDFIIAQYGSGENVIFRNMKQEGSPRTFEIAGSGELPAADTHSVSIGDVNGDGRPDVVLAHEGPQIAVYTADPTPFAYTQLVTLPTPNANRPTPVADLVDLNGDGRLDIYVGQQAGASGQPEQSVYLHSGNNAAPFGAATALANVDFWIYDARYADVDGDCQTEIITINCCDSSASRLQFLRFDGGTFQDVTSDFVSGHQGSLALELADLDKDGDLDLVVGGSVSDRSAVFVYENTTDRVCPTP